MAAPLAELLYSEEEYLALERATEERHEYLDGYIYAMAGESEEHGDICANLSGILVPQLRGTPCRARIANSKVRSGPRPAVRRRPKGLYSYPDLFVVCGEMQYHDQYKDVIINPTVIFEVLSESTEKFDRGEKFLRYQNYNHSLQDYLLVSQLSATVEHYTRQADGSWNYRVYTGRRARFTIKSIKCQVKLAELYERVKFPPSESEEATAGAPPTVKRPARAKTKTPGRKK